MNTPNDTITAKTPREVALYMRGNPDSYEGCEGQRHELQEFAAARGFVIVAHYVDWDRSSGTGARPALASLLARPAASSVLAVNLSRFSRDARTFAEVMDAFADAGITVITPDGEWPPGPADHRTAKARTGALSSLLQLAVTERAALSRIASQVRRSRCPRVEALDS